jgi:hypothetical protein
MAYAWMLIKNNAKITQFDLLCVYIYYATIFLETEDKYYSFDLPNVEKMESHSKKVQAKLRLPLHN